jgi:hypothetical protein
MKTEFGDDECWCIMQSDFLKKRSELRATRAAVQDKYYSLLKQHQSMADMETQNRVEKVKGMIPGYNACNAEAPNTNSNIVPLAMLLEYMAVEQSENHIETKRLTDRIDALEALSAKAAEAAVEAALAAKAAAKAVAEVLTLTPLTLTPLTLTLLMKPNVKPNPNPNPNLVNGVRVGVRVRVRISSRFTFLTQSLTASLTL